MSTTEWQQFITSAATCAELIVGQKIYFLGNRTDFNQPIVANDPPRWVLDPDRYMSLKEGEGYIELERIPRGDTRPKIISFQLDAKPIDKWCSLVCQIVKAISGADADENINYFVGAMKAAITASTADSSGRMSDWC